MNQRINLQASSTCNFELTYDLIYSYHINLKTKLHITVPSSAPTSFTLTASSSTSITASWQLPPADSRNGIITGFILFYKKKGSAGSTTRVPINSGATLSKHVTGLDKYTEYEFQVLAFTSVGDGLKSSVVVKRTKEDGVKNYQFLFLFNKRFYLETL